MASSPQRASQSWGGEDPAPGCCMTSSPVRAEGSVATALGAEQGRPRGACSPLPAPAVRGRATPSLLRFPASRTETQLLCHRRKKRLRPCVQASLSPGAVPELPALTDPEARQMRQKRGRRGPGLRRGNRRSREEDGTRALLVRSNVGAKSYSSRSEAALRVADQINKYERQTVTAVVCHRGIHASTEAQSQ